jgi:chromosome segregation ATPase
MNPDALEKAIAIWSRREDLVQRELHEAVVRVSAAQRAYEDCAAQRQKLAQDLQNVRRRNLDSLSDGTPSIEDIRRLHRRAELINDHLSKAQDSERAAAEKLAAAEAQRKDIAAKYFRLKIKRETACNQLSLAHKAAAKTEEYRLTNTIHQLGHWRIAAHQRRNG